jgi:hypothetical protein
MTSPVGGGSAEEGKERRRTQLSVSLADRVIEPAENLFFRESHQ